DPVYPPLKILDSSKILATLDEFRPAVRLAGLRGVPEAGNQLVRVGLRPQNGHHLVEVAADQVGDLPTHRTGKRAGLTNAKLGLQEAEGKPGRVEPCLDFGRSLAKRNFRSLALGHVDERSRDICGPSRSLAECLGATVNPANGFARSLDAEFQIQVFA